MNVKYLVLTKVAHQDGEARLPVFYGPSRDLAYRMRDRYRGRGYGAVISVMDEMVVN